MRGRPKTELVLTKTEQEHLMALTLRRKTAQALALRARIVLACAQGVDNKVVATRQRVTLQTVSKWRTRFVQHRLDGLLDALRPGAPRTIDGTRVDAVIAKTLESVPDGATHWSTRAIARDAGLSQTAVARIWRAFGLQPQVEPGRALVLHADAEVNPPRYPSLYTSTRTGHTYIEVNNDDPKPFVWSKTADDILASIERFCLRTSKSVHPLSDAINTWEHNERADWPFRDHP